MVILDTHIWIWWVNSDPKLSPEYHAYITAEEKNGIGVSAISCWEIAMLVQNSRLTLNVPVEHWLVSALAYPGIVLISLTPEIAVESTRLPGTFHKDSADRIITATARRLGCPLMTRDLAIRDYPHVQIAL